MLWKRREIVSTPESVTMVCPRCLSIYPEDSLFCLNDGSKLLMEKAPLMKEPICNQCGAYIPSPGEECPECGYVPVHSTLVLRLTPLLSSSIMIWKFPYEFGRADISRLNGAQYVNAKHILFYLSENSIMARDLKTLNGTKINGVKMGKGNFSKENKLKTGDVLELALNAQGEGMVKIMVNMVEVRGY